MIDLKQLKRLIKLMTDNELTELDLQDGDERVCLKRGMGGQPQVHMAPVMSQPMASTAAPVSGAAPTADSADDEGLIRINCPMVGTFYSAASPDAKPFVNTGQSIDPESVVCIVEACKVFNEIKAEVSGTIERILVENGQTVEFEQALFLVRP